MRKVCKDITSAAGQSAQKLDTKDGYENWIQSWIQRTVHTPTGAGLSVSVTGSQLDEIGLFVHSKI